MLSQSTYRRFFGKFSQKRNTEVFPVLQNWFLDQIAVDNLTVDFDSTVITRYGEQEGSAKGNNPNKQGRNSQHPLRLLWVRPEWPMHGSGNTGDSSSCKLFMKETFDQALRGKKVVLVRSHIEIYIEELLNHVGRTAQLYHGSKDAPMRKK